MTWDDIKRGAAEAEAKFPELVPQYADERAKLLPIIDTAEWQGQPPEREFAWGDWIPLRQSTMLTGEGGVGKSLLAQMLCTCIAFGRPFLGMETRQMSALYVTAEDDADELWRRQAAICSSLQIPLPETTGPLILVSLAGEAETALARLTDDKIKSTDLWRQVLATASARAVRFSVFDNATDMMAGDHNDVHQVAAFVNLLTGLAIRTNGVSLILHHPNKGGADWLGSVAWHNKVRSRLIVKHSEDEDDPDCRVIENPKANYGPSRGKVAFRWHHGAFVRDEDLPSDHAAELHAITRANGENRRFLECLAKATEERRATSPSPSASNYAPRVFAKMTVGKGISEKGFAAAMERLLHLGTIANGQRVYQRDNRQWVTGLGRLDLAPTPAPTPAPTNAQRCTEGSV